MNLIKFKLEAKCLVGIFGVYLANDFTSPDETSNVDFIKNSWHRVTIAWRREARNKKRTRKL